MKSDYQDRIDLYLFGKMSDIDRLLFEEDLSVNSDLREQYEFTLNLQRALKSRNDKFNRIKELEKLRMAQEQRKSIKRKWKRIILFSSGIAASALLVVLFNNPLIFNRDPSQNSPNIINNSNQFKFDYSTDADSVGVKECGDSENTVEQDTIYEMNESDSMLLNPCPWMRD